MKITVNIDENCIENEVVIKCSRINEEIIDLQKLISSHMVIVQKLNCLKIILNFMKQ